MTDWTTARVTPEIQAELRRLLDAATPGPWETDGCEVSQHWSRPEPWRTIASSEVSCGPYCYGGRGQGIEQTEDATLIVAAVNAIPALLDAAAERDALAAKVERVRALADEWTYNGEFGWDDGSHAYGPDCEGQALDYAAAKLRRALDEEPQS